MNIFDGMNIKKSAAVDYSQAAIDSINAERQLVNANQEGGSPLWMERFDPDRANAVTLLTTERGQSSPFGSKDGGYYEIGLDADGNEVFRQYHAPSQGFHKKALMAAGALAGVGALAGSAAGAGAAAGSGAAGGAGSGAGFVGEGALSGIGAWDSAMAAGSGAGAAGGAAGAAGGLSSATKAALFGDVGYGAGMTGLQTGVFDTVLAATGSTGMAGAAAGAAGAAGNAGSWLGSTLQALAGGGAGGQGGGLLGSLFGGSSVLRDIFGLLGAGVEQWNIERMADDNRKWQSAEKEKDRQFELKKAADMRRRQMPVDNIFGRARVLGGSNG